MKASVSAKSPPISSVRSIPPWPACTRDSNVSDCSGSKTMLERDSQPEDLALQALLYSSGEVEGSAATAFEARLAVDQAAREALAQVVQLSLLASGRAPLPDPAW